MVGKFWCICISSFRPVLPCCLCYTYTVFVALILYLSPLIFYFCVVAESLLLHRVSPSVIDVCFVLFRSAPSSLLLLLFFLLLHPVWATCIWGLLCFQLCLSLPLQEWTLRNTFRFVRRKNARGSIAGTGWRRAEVWIWATEIVFREGLFVSLCLLCKALGVIWLRIKQT